MMEPPFVGRRLELSAIQAAADEASRDGRPRAVVIVGEPGSGKSRLMAEARTRAPGLQILEATGYEAERSVPMAAVAGVLERLASLPSGGLLAALLQQGREPTIRSSNSGRATSGPLEILRLLEATSRALAGIPGVGLWVDDVQWLDDLSRASLHFLIRAAAGGRGRSLILVAAGRPGFDTGRLIEDLAPLVETTVLDLGPLARDDAKAMLHALSPELSADEAEEFVGDAAGSPFWIEAIARSRRGDIGLDRLVAVRLAALAPGDRELLATLAVAARPVTAGQLAVAARLPRRAVGAGIQRLINAGLAVQEGPALRVVHDIVRAALTDALPDTDRRQLHRAWAAAIEADAGIDVAELATALSHRRSAGLPSIELALRLARSPRRRLLGTEGVRSLGIVADESSAVDPDGTELAEAVATLASELNAHELALDRWTAVAERTSDPARIARARLACARECYRMGRGQAAHAWLDSLAGARAADQGIEIGSLVVDALVTILLDHRPQDGWRLGRRAVEAAGRAVAGAGGLEEAPPEIRSAAVDAYRAGVIVALQTGAPEAMLATAAEMADAARDHDEAAHIDALVSMSIAYRSLGRIRDAIGVARQAWRQATAKVLPAASIDAGTWLAMSLHDFGELDEAASVAAEVDELIRRAGDFVSFTRISARRLTEEIARTRGDWQEATRSMLAKASREPDGHARVSLHQSVLVWATRRGSDPVAEIIEQLDRGRSAAQEGRCERCRLEFELYAVEALVRLGRFAEAGEALRSWDAAQPQPTPQQALVRRWIEVLLTSADHPLAASDRLAELAEEADDAGRRIEAIWLRLDRARALQAAGSTKAAEAYRRAASDAAAIGATSLERIGEQGLRALGVRTWRRGPASAAEAPSRLSERELQIARLVAGGSSNPEIASQLFLSRKTVEHHVSNILAKLGLRNRAELAALMGERAEQMGGAPR
jgi:DNA-binding CsgD family transcriptional regulator